MTCCIDHRIEGSSAGFQTDYPLLFRVYRGYGTNTGNTVYIPPSELSRDFNDIRFVDAIGAILPHWIETTGTNYIDVWVKLNRIPTTGTSIRVLSGGGVVSASNGSTTFPTLFDDFNSSLDTSKWGSQIGTVTTESGSLKVGSGSNSWSRVISTAAAPTNFRLVSYAKIPVCNDVSHDHWVGACTASTTSVVAFVNTGGDTSQSYIRIINATGNSTTIQPATIDFRNTWARFECVRASSYLYFYVNGALAKSYTTGFETGTMYANPQVYDANDYLYVDWLFLSNFCNPEPTHGWWGTLEDV